MKQLRRGKNLVQATFKAPSPPAAESRPSGEAVSVGKAGSIADGEMSAHDVNGEPVAIANVGGAYYAFHDTCTHRRCSLSEGELDGTTLTCICHGSRFDITTGEVVRGPAPRPLKVFNVRLEGDDLRIEASRGEG